GGFFWTTEYPSICAETNDLILLENFTQIIQNISLSDLDSLLVYIDITNLDSLSDLDRNILYIKMSTLDQHFTYFAKCPNVRIFCVHHLWQTYFVKENHMILV
ncbi:hypothetical protein ACJX0J_038037, partial [Zea mays]